MTLPSNWPRSKKYPLSGARTGTFGDRSPRGCNRTVAGEPSRIGNRGGRTSHHAAVTLAQPESPSFAACFVGVTTCLPRRWESANSGKSGYAPACRNEWVRGICQKPTIKCGDCPNQAFISVFRYVLRISRASAPEVRTTLLSAYTPCCRMRPVGFLLPTSTRHRGCVMLQRSATQPEHSVFQ